MSVPAQFNCGRCCRQCRQGARRPRQGARHGRWRARDARRHAVGRRRQALKRRGAAGEWPHREPAVQGRPAKLLRVQREASVCAGSAARPDAVASGMNIHSHCRRPQLHRPWRANKGRVCFEQSRDQLSDSRPLSRRSIMVDHPRALSHYAAHLSSTRPRLISRPRST
jgi:hypothetical protein